MMLLIVKFSHGELSEFLKVYFNSYEFSKKMPHNFILHYIFHKNGWKSFLDCW